MKKRKFAANKKIILSGFPKNLRNDWTPKETDFKIIRARIAEKIKKKPGFYRYCGEYRGEKFFLRLLKK